MTTIPIEKLDRLPDSALSEVSNNIESSGSSELSGIGIVDEKDVIQGANHTHLDAHGEASARTDSPGVPTGENAATSPVLTQTTGIKQPVPIGTLFNGKVGIELVDMLFPALIVLVADNVLGYDVPKKELQLTASEKATIAPFMQAYLDSVNVQMSPLGALVAVMAGVYAAKFMEVFPSIKKKARTKQTTATVIEMKPSQSRGNIAEPKLSEAEMMKRIAKTKNLSERQQQYANFILPMQYDVAIAHIKTTRRVSADDAKKWYTKYVTPLKQKK